MPTLAHLIGGLFLLSSVMPLWGQADAVELQRMLARGADAAVLQAVKAEAAKGPLSADWLELALQAATNTGATELCAEYSAAWVQGAPQSAAAACARAAYLRELGRGSEAAALVEPFSRPRVPAPTAEPAFDFASAVLVAALQRDAGHAPEADAVLDRVLEESRRVVVRHPRDLIALSSVYVQFGGAKEAETVLVEAQKAVAEAQRTHPEVPQLDGWRPTLALAHLYLDQFHLEGDAVEEGKATLQLRADLADAHGLLGRAYESWQKPAESAAAFARAVGVNAHQTDAILARVEVLLGDANTSAAKQMLDTFLPHHPRNMGALGLAAAQMLLDGDAAACAAALTQAERSSASGAAGGKALPRLMVAAVLSNRRRWSESLVFAQAAAQLEPSNGQAHDAVARYALYLGADDVAATALKAAAAAEKFSHVRRKNMAEFVRVVGRFYDDVPTEHLTLRLAKRERAALEPTVAAFAEKSWCLLRDKYAFTPAGLDAQGRLRVEVLLSTGDLTARTFSLPRQGFLGFCFGPLLTMLSPSAMPPGSGSWARTLHHELAHSFALGLSRGRVPRWLTEGLSTWEERALVPAWDRHMDLELHDALAAGELIPVRQFEAAFGTPRVVFAYFQAGIAVEWLVRECGMERMRALLVALGEDQGFAQASQAILGLSLDDIDRGIAAAARERVAKLRRVPRLSESALKEAAAASGTATAATLVSAAATLLDRTSMAAARVAVDKVEAKLGVGDAQLLGLQGRLALKAGDKEGALKSLLAACAGGLEDFEVQAALGKLLLDKGDSEGAETALRASIAFFPLNAQRNGPRRQLVRLLLSKGRSDDAQKILTEHLEVDSDDIEGRAELLKLLAVKSDHKEILRQLEMQILIQPMDSALHLQSGQVLTHLKRFGEAEAALRVGLACQPTTPAEADLLAALGEALLALGRPADALSAAEKALALVPEHKIAKDVRLRAGAR